MPDYKNTLLMPKTDFEMRGNLKQKDPLFNKSQEDNNVYNTLSSRDAEEFILHDGPPYANGDLHMGHALNKILKDIIVRNEALKGKKIDWRFGWDTHGLPIEMQVQKNGIKLSEVGKDEYLKACYKYAYKQVERQQKQFKSFALLTDYEQKYLTLKPEFEAGEIEVFNEMFNQGLIYQDLKPVYWSWSSETALADAEIEYKDIESHSIFVPFKNKDGINFLIWTTTPWTLPANVAVALGEKIEYALVEIEEQKYIIAKELIEKVSNDIGKEIKYIESINNDDYINQVLTNPLNGKESKVVYGHHVTTEGGTGLVHIAGGHGLDDYMIVKQNDLELFIVMDDKGHMINSDEFDGQFYLKASDNIVEKLKENGTLLFNTKFTHSAPIDWRTKKPVVFRATKQWFVSFENIRDGLVQEIEKTDWIPSWGENRLKNMTIGRDDWCISRQRLWGVPIPIIYDEKGEPIKSKELQDNIVNLYKEKGMLGWHQADIKDLLPSSIEYKEGMRKETDILDVWFDSGSSHQSVLKGKQADLYLEGNDQYRGWFNSSLTTSYVMNKQAPYKQVITHGMVVDSKGNKMSKSIGNTIDPLSISDQYGADILRLWVANSDYTDNVKISDDIIKQISTDYRNIRNKIRFILANISDYDDSKPNLNLLSRATIKSINYSWSKVMDGYNTKNFVQVIKTVNDELTSGSISVFIEYSKNVLYVKGENSEERRGAQFVLKHALNFILYSLAPIIPVTIDEAYKSAYKDESIFLSTYPTFDEGENQTWNQFKEIKNVVQKEFEPLKESKEIKQMSELGVKLSLPTELMTWTDGLKEFLVVAKIEVFESEELKAEVYNFDGTKCERCWRFFESNEIKEDICLSCDEVVKNV